MRRPACDAGPARTAANDEAVEEGPAVVRVAVVVAVKVPVVGAGAVPEVTDVPVPVVAAESVGLIVVAGSVVELDAAVSVVVAFAWYSAMSRT